MEAVADFYKEADNDKDWKRRLQSGPIMIDVNFVLVSDSDGVIGNVTQKMVDDQMAVLNTAYSPDFNFRLSNVQRVTDDNLVLILARDPLELPTPREAVLKTIYRKGGTETLNVYSLVPYVVNASNATVLIPGFSTLPYPAFSEGDLDGVVLLYATMPGGRVNGYNQGDVSTHFLCPDPRWLYLLECLTVSPVI
jgi:hypothetical protein